MMLDIYDLDKTLLNGDSNELWHEYMLELGLLDEKFIAEDKLLMDLYTKGQLDMDEYLAFAVSALVKLDEQTIKNLMWDFLEKKIKPIVFQEAKDIISKAKHKLIISATPEFIVAPISQMLGIDQCIGMKLVRKDGLFDGSYEKPLSYRDGKVECLKLWLKQNGIKPKKISFYSDSINDLPLLEHADKAFCVNPDEKLKEEAKRRRWTVYNWG